MSEQVKRKLKEMVATPLEVLVIGGGIVGSGVARDAALRGLRVGLVDQYDFAFGTSSRSSRLLHGGLRYLAQGRVGLVREASVEKMTLHRIAPHLAMPLPFIFPTRARTPWKYWKMRVGVKLYDLLCGGRNLGKSSGMTADEVRQALPGVNSDRLTGAVRYFDGFTNDARLVLDTLRSAEAGGAMLANYAEVTRAQRSGEAWRVGVVDRLSDESVELTTKCIINAAGAWAPRFPASRTKLRLSKGVHMVIDRSRLPVNEAVVMAEGTRILFVIPWGERIILGTTDTDYQGPLDEPGCDESDVQYILDVTNRTFTTARITAEDVISTWSGLRPLIADPHGKPSDISRAHQIQMAEPGWFDVAGGKLTTYRLMAEQTVDQVIKHANLRASACTTATTPLLSPEDSKFSGIVPVAVSREAVAHYCHREWAIHLDDVMTRRTSWRYYHRDHFRIAQDVADWMGQELSWSDEVREQELARYTGAAQRARCKTATTQQHVGTTA